MSTIPALTRILGPPSAWLDRLTEGERAQLERYEAAKRRDDWLLGRAAAKQALRSAWKARGVTPPDWSRFEIRSSASGAPRLHGLDPAHGTWAVSLTHGHGQAAAFALPAGQEGGLPGVDLERVRARRLGSLRFFLHPEERAWVLDLPLADPSDEPDTSRRPAGPRDVAAIVLWALKEAAFKAIQPPRGTGLLDVEVTLEDPFDATEGRAALSYRGVAAERARALGVAGLKSGWTRDGELVLAWVEAEAGRLPAD